MAFWTRIRDARLALVDGSVMNAERLLQIPIEAPSLPEHLRAVVIIERAFLAALAEDRQTLVGLTQALQELGLSGEAALLRGLYADLTGDRRAAADHFSTAAATVRISQPPCRALALTCEAQVRDALGERDAALQALQTAVTITEVRRNPVPFLGWSRQGTSVHVLLDRLHRLSPEPWLAELLAATDGQPGIVAVLAPWTPTVRERAAAPDSMFLPALTPSRARGPPRARPGLDVRRHRGQPVRLGEHRQDARVQPLRQARRLPAQRGSRGGSEPEPAVTP